MLESERNGWEKIKETSLKKKIKLSRIAQLSRWTGGEGTFLNRGNDVDKGSLQ